MKKSINAATAFLKGAQKSDIGHDNQCPRAVVRAAVLSRGIIASCGRNKLYDSFDGCSCDDNADTTKEGSKTCKSIHAELSALMDAWSKGYLQEEVGTIAVTRSPCRICCATLLETDIKTIVTIDKFDDRDGSKEVWESAGREWIILKGEDL